MPTALAPIKISVETDRLVAHMAHFMHMSKKEVVDRAVQEYVDRHREEIDSAVREMLTQLDGTRPARLSLLTGLDAAELDELGGVD